eukprot:CAMPEP_0174979140 /NCGR_PEP_ID=MMETSP0004_2-20121128/14606_1 /TAXON_ID=420556 /ORGANISM="Ochromonas sp., Strain CCMP1393" /LENGTH=115 /DNA_ID=CAMNT_0016230615 /DNA_START=190 /DNA_END=537 /DNA_ORIENTATION=-
METASSVDDMEGDLSMEVEAEEETKQTEDCVSPKSRPSRRVSFYRSVEVTLIPCIEEYKEAQLHNHVWWGRPELDSFKRELAQEFHRYVAENNLCDVDPRLSLKHFEKDVLKKIK